MSARSNAGPTIDAVFCGFGGASYYPNALHAPAKNDRAMARLREQLFIHNFCRIAHELAPRIAIPFAADFVLLAPHQRWINDVRFSREDIPAYYQQHFGQETVVHAMYPGDRLVDGTLEAVSPYRAQLQSRRLDHLIAQQYPDEVSAFRVSERLRSDDEANGQWAVRLAAHLNSQVKFHPRRALEGLSFGVRLRDLQSRSCFNARWTGSVFEVTNGNAFLASSMANIETTTAVLETSIENDWGGDVLTIGYACDVTVLDSRAPGKVRLCVSLLTRYPRPKSYALTHPMRTMDYLYQSAPLVMARLKNKLRATINRSGEEEVITSPQWLTGNVETIRQACRLPVLPDF